MARGKFNHLNVSKCSEAELAHLKSAAPSWLEVGEKVYTNHSGEWYARKFAHGYRIVSYVQLLENGWVAQGGASTLKGVREVVEFLHNEREAAKAENRVTPWG